ncbi:MAG: hydroxyphenylacetyl-CoA thioesterase PaaI [Burkholderiaceae bacterium]
MPVQTSQTQLPEQLNSGETEAQAIAQAAARAMWADDTASQSLGMQLLSVEPGRASMKMTVRPDMTNGHGMCHGGFIFLLADSTFAFACNSHNQRAVAASAEIHFLSSAQRNDVLNAVASETHRAGRSGVYDIRVTNQSGNLIAVFRGKSATIKGEIVES